MDTLPVEIMTYILDLLPFKYRRNMATMNKTWYSASLHPTLLRKEFLVYNEDIHNEFDVFTNVLLKTERKFLKLKLQKIHFHNDKHLSIFKNLGDRIISLHLTNLPYVDEAFLEAITCYCKNIKKLVLYNTTFHIYKPCTPIPQLHNITLNQVQNLSDLEFNLFVQCAPNVKKFFLMNCRILVWPQSIKRYYPDNIVEYNSDQVFTTLNISNYLSNVKSLKKLNVQTFFQFFCRLPEYIKLDSLSVSLQYYFVGLESTPGEFKFKLAEQTSLKKLVISLIPCCFLSSVSKLHNLNYLELTYTVNTATNCFDNTSCVQKFYDSLENMKNLKTLIITWIIYDSQPNLTFTIPECTLKSLKVLNSTIESTLSVINLGQNLDSLHIQTSQIILQANDFLLLFSKLTKLRQLKIEDCSELTDAILLSSPVSNIKGLKMLHLFETRLTHRILRHFELLHLEHLVITNLSLRCIKPQQNIEWSNFLDFKESMKQLGHSAPVLTTLELLIPNNESILLRNDTLRNSLMNSNAYFDYFKNLKAFELGYND